MFELNFRKLVGINETTIQFSHFSNLNQKVVPTPTLESIENEQLCASRTVRTIARPRPVPIVLPEGLV